MNPVGIRFLLSDGQFFLTVMPEASAKQIIKAWTERQLPFVYGADNWAVKMDTVKAIHLFDPAELQQQQPQQQPRWFPGKSGVN